MSLFVLAVGLYFVKRWLAHEALHHPERQMIDALDRMVHGMIVLLTMWLVVSCLTQGISATQIWLFTAGG